ncbi:MAG: Universal stress protein family 4, partial [uncultured Solirubrobacteraceae bacterium]
VRIDRGGHRRFGHGPPGRPGGGRPRPAARRDARRGLRLRAGLGSAPARGVAPGAAGPPVDDHPARGRRRDAARGGRGGRGDGSQGPDLRPGGRPCRRDPRRGRGAGRGPHRGGQQGHDRGQAVPARIRAQQGVAPRPLQRAHRPHDV